MLNSHVFWLYSSKDENWVNRPVCSYVRPLRAGRLLDTPRQAARFVNVLGYEKATVVGGGSKQEQWCTLLPFLSRNKVSVFFLFLFLCFVTIGDTKSHDLEKVCCVEHLVSRLLTSRKKNSLLGKENIFHSDIWLVVLYHWYIYYALGYIQYV